MEIQHYKGGDILTYQKTLAQKKKKKTNKFMSAHFYSSMTHTHKCCMPFDGEEFAQKKTIF